MISLTDTACDHIFDYLKQRGKGIGIRIGVKTTGCSGFAYVVEPVDKAEEYDQVFKNKGIDVYVDNLDTTRIWKSTGLRSSHFRRQPMADQRQIDRRPVCDQWVSGTTLVNYSESCSAFTKHECFIKFIFMLRVNESAEIQLS